MKKHWFTALFIVVAVFLCSCDSLDNKNTTTEVTDDKKVKVTGELLLSDDTEDITGYPVTINDTVIRSSPQKVVCLSSSLTEIIYELGYGDRLIGRGSYCDYPETVTSLKDYGKPASPDLNSLKESSPDLLITATSIPSKDTSALSELGISVLYIPSPRSVEEYGNIYRALGMTFEGMIDGEEAGNKLFIDVKASLTGSGISLGKFVYVTEGGAIAGGDTFESSVLSMFGENIAASASGYSFDKNLLAENQPDTVILNNDVPESELRDDEVLGSLDAIKAGNIISINNAYFESPSGRLTDLLDELTVKKGADNEA